MVNDAEKGSDIDPQEAQQTLEIAEANLRKAEGKRQIIEANHPLVYYMYMYFRTSSNDLCILLSFPIR
ncbi:hypothetical protein CASFOL_007826 [Castilleja foliolosa]|uniref:Uncharacterized protein n=1 Tax=Castilleja foliolosa TaxID=1961234 RepID=A0ABD3E280_9LAMI